MATKVKLHSLCESMTILLQVWRGTTDADGEAIAIEILEDAFRTIVHRSLKLTPGQMTYLWERIINQAGEE